MRIIKSFFLIVIILLFLTFAVTNHGKVSIDLFPLPYVMELPKFLMAMLFLALGAIIGWLTISLKMSRNYFQLKSDHKRILALENELNALKSEQRDQLPVPLSEQ